MVKTSFNDKLQSVSAGTLGALDLKILQVNLGYRCNMSCTHCHASSGSGRTEVMNEETAGKVLRILLDNPFETLDITGGAPELSPALTTLVTEARKANRRVIVRTNLTVFFEPGLSYFPRWYRDQGVELIASLPCYQEERVDRVRGSGAFGKSIEALRLLNQLGFGTGTLPGLSLNLVYNGDGICPSQAGLEADYKRELRTRFNVFFDRLYTFTNMPIGRFREQLVRMGNLEPYLEKLAAAFNPATVQNLMCRQLISVRWDGSLFDCDFNQVMGIPLVRDAPGHIDRFDYETLQRRKIAVDEHCYGCTAGQGSS